MLYQNCRELPYHNFNEIGITGDLKFLIKKGRHGNKELERHYIEILDEYIQLTDDFAQKKFFKDKAELKFLEVKLEILKFFEGIIKENLDGDNRKRYDRILKQYRVTDIKRSILGTQDDINLKINQLKKTDLDQKNSNFEDDLATMRMNGVNIDRFKITVSELVALKKKMRAKPKGHKANERPQR